MEAFISLIKTDNLAIILLLVGLGFVTNRMVMLEKKLDKAQDVIITLSAKVGRLEGKDSVDDKLINLLHEINTRFDHLPNKKITAG